MLRVSGVPVAAVVMVGFDDRAVGATPVDNIGRGEMVPVIAG